MIRVQETIRRLRRNRITDIRAYSRARALRQLELKREVEVMTTSDALKLLALQVRCTGSTFALIFFGCALGMALCDGLGSYVTNILFLAISAVIAAIVYYAADTLGWLMESLPEYKSRRRPQSR